MQEVKRRSGGERGTRVHAGCSGGGGGGSGGGRDGPQTSDVERGKRIIVCWEY